MMWVWMLGILGLIVILAICAVGGWKNPYDV